VHAGKVEGVELHVDAHSQSKVGETHPGKRTHILRVSHRWVGSHRASSCEEVQTSLLRRSAGEVKKQVRGCGFDPLIECALTTTRKGETTTCGTQQPISAASGRANVPRGNNWYRNNVDSSPGSSVARATRITITAM